MKNLKSLSDEFQKQQDQIRLGAGEKGIARQRRHGRLTARERLEHLLDPNTPFFELGLFAAFEMYEEWGSLPAAGVITGIGTVSGRNCMIIANDATVKAGAFFPQSVKKVLRAQKIALQCRLPTLYLVDSAGVFLPLQDEIFPDEDDFGRIFRNNAIFSAEGIPQFAAIMGNCIAGGGYLPVLCDQLLMTRGSGLYLAGPALVKAAIGQEVDTEELGGAAMHASISGTVDYLEEDDESCLKHLRELVSFLPEEEKCPVSKSIDEVYNIVSADNKEPYDVRDLIKTIVDQESFLEYKAEYGKTIVTGYARIEGQNVGIVASQRKHGKTAKGEVELGGVLYTDSADKTARFIMDCNQTRTPLLFIQDVTGFMVGKAAEESGIIKAGAKIVNALSNSIVPKITLIVGNSFGAGHYALCGKAYDPNFILAWPNASYAVMGGDQAAATLFEIQKKQAEREGHPWDEVEAEKKRKELSKKYQSQMDIRYGAARGWVDAIIPPHETKKWISASLHFAREKEKKKQFQTGVIQV